MKKQFSQRVLAILFASNLTLLSFSQDMPKVIPPSPEAASIVGYGNTNVNFYTGSPSFSIPIHTASNKDASLQISLSYTGFGGIKVEEVAPWVGLGWTLNAGGVVSRTIRGRADDEGGGYQTLPPLPDLTTSSSSLTTYQDYADGDLDGEPDEFNYNVNGLSGTFYINKSKQVVEQVKSNVKIVPVFSGHSIIRFEITDTHGLKYVFSEQEVAKSFEMSEAPGAIAAKTNSWYLSSINSAAGEELISLTYYNWSNSGDITWQYALKNVTYGPQSELDLGVVFGQQHMYKSWNYVKPKRIHIIDFKKGKVVFNESNINRQDYRNDYWLDNIQVTDSNNVLIKKFKLEYSYFTATGTAAINSTPTGIGFQGLDTGDHERRLKLDRVIEVGNDGITEKPPYVFTYNSTHYLPSRFSFAQDHWGYYNGQTGNTSPEPVQRVKYYDAASILRLVGFGTANREPSEAHSQAGILTKVSYPTGGYTSFTYGQHEAIHPKLKNDYLQQSYNFQPNGTWHTITVSLINDPYEVLSINADASGTCNIGVEFYNQAGTTYITGQTMTYVGSGMYSHGTKTVTLQPGTYKVRAVKYGCSVVATDNINLQWKNEVAKTNKPVGGLRIEAIVDHDGISSANDVRREFYYNENGDGGTSNSTGRILNAPTYGGQVIHNEEAYAPNVYMKPNGYRRAIQSTYPLMKTNGSEVGYGKVTVRTIGVENIGKTEYYFTTAADYQDLYDGYYYTPLNGETYFTTTAAGTHETFPFPRPDSRDYLRGLLLKQIDYRWTGSTYHKVKEVINTYVSTFNAPADNGSILPWVAFLPTNTQAANGMNYVSIEGAVWKPGAHNHFKRYRFYTGRVDLEKTITRTYDLGSTTNYLETETTNFWDDLPSYYFNVSRVQTKDSEGVTRETRFYYPYDQSSLTGLTTPEINALSAMRNTLNMIAPVIQQEEYVGTTKTSTVRNNFEYFSTPATYLPSSIEVAKGSSALETRLTMHEYDANRNLLSVSKDGGVKYRYLYAYGNAHLPVAQVIGADSNNDIAYTSFEALEKGNWTYSENQYTDVNSPSGKMYYRLSLGSISKTGLSSSKKYKVTFYAKNGVPTLNGVQSSVNGAEANAHGWTYYERVVTGISTLTISSGTAYIDELRLYPIDAQMITYTYEPMVGVTTEVGMNHNILRYQYDKFSRLELIKDWKGHVIKAFDYQYQTTTSY